MMGFSDTQTRLLAGKLQEKFIRTREHRGTTLSYIEAWHAIDEANRVFGFDGWDRETVSAECVWQDVRVSPKACSYAVRVRIRVRAGKTIVSREGTGIGHGTSVTLGEAHESALKEAETDATKRALVTFGNLFGLALYDKEQAGVRRVKGTGHAAPVVWPLVTGNAPPQICETPQQFCSAAKENLRYAKSTAELEALWTGNAAAIAQLRAARPELRTKQGTHYADVLESLYRQQRRTLEPVAPSDRQPVKTLAQGQPTSMAVEPRSPEAKTVDGLVAAAERTTVVAPPEVSMVELRSPILVPAGGTPVAQTPEDAVSTPAIPMARRVRDAAHLKYVASLPCLVCGRTPSHAHHLRF
ncbi:MAG: Rad52/Rad22 family DNA repair protein, partial [Acetobacteraceae bacterium]